MVVPAPLPRSQPPSSPLAACGAEAPRSILVVLTHRRCLELDPALCF